MCNCHYATDVYSSQQIKLFNVTFTPDMISRLCPKRYTVIPTERRTLIRLLLIQTVLWLSHDFYRLDTGDFWKYIIQLCSTHNKSTYTKSDTVEISSIHYLFYRR